MRSRARLTMKRGIHRIRQKFWVRPRKGNYKCFQPVVEIILDIGQAACIRFIIKFVHREEVPQAREVGSNHCSLRFREPRMTDEVALKESQQREEAIIPIDVAILLGLPPKLFDRTQQFALHGV